MIAIKPPFPHLDIGHRVRFTATEFDENGEEVIGSVFSWSSDDEAVVTVDEAGLVTAVSYGTAQITAQTDDTFGVSHRYGQYRQRQGQTD